MRVKAIIGMIGKEDSWDELFTVESLQTAEKEIKDIVEEFNASEERRYGVGVHPKRELKKIVGEFVVNTCEGCGQIVQLCVCEDEEDEGNEE